MKGNEYNDLWKIISNMPESAVSSIPEKYLAFVKSAMVPDGDSIIRDDIPLEEQVLTEELRGLLACLNLTYWATDAEDRYELACTLHRNEMMYQGKDEAELTSEELQSFLSNFDDWNDLFGPIPFWAESRGWKPRTCYEIVPEDEAEIVAGKTGLKEVYVTKDQRDQILEEAKEWVLIAEKKWEETLYWHDNDHSEGSSMEETEDFYKRHVVVKDEHFFGALLETDLTSSMGMSVYRNKDYGVLLIDGTRDGRTYEHYSHSSDEVSESEDTTYYLKRR